MTRARRSGQVRSVLVVLVAGLCLVLSGVALAQGPQELDALSSFIRHWIEGRQTGTYVPSADLNGDLVVDYMDAALALEDTLRGPAVLSPEAVVLASDGSVTAVLAGDSEIRLTGEVPSLKPGQIIVGAQDAALLHRVESVSEHAGEVVVRTSQASLADVVEKGSFRLILPPAEDAPIEWDPEARPDVAQSQPVRTEALRAGINLGALTLARSVASGSSARILAGRLNYCPSVDIGARFDHWRLTEFHAVATGKLTLAATMRLENRGPELAAKSEVRLCTVPLGDHIAWIPSTPPVPVLVSPRLSFSIGFEMGGNTSFTAIEKEYFVQLSVKLGACYNNGVWTPVADPDFDSDVVVKELDLGAGMWAKLYVKPKLEVYLYRVVGPSLDLDVYAKGVLTVNPAERAGGCSDV